MRELRPFSFSLPWYQAYNVDIIAAAVLAALLLLGACLATCLGMRRCVRTTQRKCARAAVPKPKEQ
ncbi:hypothetical protein EON66_10630 [archaeon]|nr:MAG: hypothetical protein EON66_10630 [archaeon]